MNVKPLWNAFCDMFRSRYVRFLEQELIRLREENIRLVESCMANAGMPIHHRYESKPTKPVQGRLMPSQLRRQFEMETREKPKEPNNVS